MENIIPGFRKHHHDDDEEYRHTHRRSGYGPGHGGGYEYTGQPMGFEHMGSPPKANLEDMDPKTIAQLGYEGPEGERRKMEAITDVHEYRAGYGPPRHEGYEREYDRHGNRHGHSSSSTYGQRRHHGNRRDSDSDDDYPEADPRYRRDFDRYGRPRPVGYVRPSTVHVDRKYEEDGTIVENVYPENSGGATFSRPDPGKIHYGRQESFPEMVLQEAAAAYGHDRHRSSHGVRREHYPAGYSYDRPPPSGYAPPYSDATSSYTRRPNYDGGSSEFVEERYRQY